jgi:hypothetical protein
MASSAAFVVAARTNLRLQVVVLQLQDRAVRASAAIVTSAIHQ